MVTLPKARATSVWRSHNGRENHDDTSTKYNCQSKDKRRSLHRRTRRNIQTLSRRLRSLLSALNGHCYCRCRRSVPFSVAVLPGYWATIIKLHHCPVHYRIPHIPHILHNTVCCFSSACPTTSENPGISQCNNVLTRAVFLLRPPSLADNCVLSRHTLWTVDWHFSTLAL